MDISPQGLAIITKWEGYHRKLPDGKCTTYYCPAGVLTIGFGSTKGIRKGQVWTHDEALRGLRRELDDCERAVNQYVSVDLTQAQYDVLVSFAYNCGTGALKGSTLLQLLNAGNYEGARRQLSRWTRGGGRVLPGLVNRRRDEQAHWIRDIPIYTPAAGDIIVTDKETGKSASGKALGLPAPDVDDLPTEPMPQQVDAPPPAKEILQKSRKWNLILWLRSVFGLSAIGSSAFLGAGTITELKSYLDTVAGFVNSYGLPTLVAMGVLGYIATEMLKKYQEQDVEDGRYTPSGEEPL